MALTLLLSDYKQNSQMVNAAGIGWRARRLLCSGNLFKGTVHSVFTSSCNIDLRCGSLIGIVNGKQRYSLNVNVPQIDWSRVTRGMSVTVGDGFIYLPEVGIRILLDGINAWRPCLSCTPASTVKIREANKIAAELGYKHGNMVGLGDLLGNIASDGHPQSGKLNEWAARVQRHLKDLVFALLNRDHRGAAEAAQFITGLGLGLTPSGDDLLAGLIGAWWWWEDSLKGCEDSLKQCFEAITGTARASTNTLGYQEIACASQGEMPESAFNVVEALLAGKRQLDGNINCLLSIGASSGTDMLAGICTAFHALCKWTATG